MKNHLTWMLTALFVCACGSVGMHKNTATADEAYAPPGGDADEGYVRQESMAAGSPVSYDMEDELSAELEAAPEEMAPQAPKSAPMERSMEKNLNAPSTENPPKKDSPKDSQSDAEIPEGPMIIYNGYLHLRVKRLMDSLDRISEMTRKQGGYVDSLTERSIVVRIPGDRFEAMIAAFAKLGDVLAREISAVEVTEQYTDLQSRLAVAEKTRERLLLLLEKLTDSRERLRVLEEIKRLSEQIESIKSTLATLQNLLKYFTITIDLTPILEDGAAISHQSPFAWIRELSPHRTTLFDGGDNISLKLPDDFVRFSKEDDYRAQSADTTIIRGGLVANDPVGDNTYWADSIIYEMTGRSESLEKRGATKNMTWLLFKNAELQPRWYLTALHADAEDLYVIEVFFPNEDAFNSHGDAILKSLETFEVKK
ncbi:MAG: DUF4349 domain-containing protein [Deltaproteobacteria bacterium]|nr:DUF4349 domain-containing protein [Deltaproteobacteria bacterium]